MIYYIIIQYKTIQFSIIQHNIICMYKYYYNVIVKGMYPQPVLCGHAGCMRMRALGCCWGKKSCPQRSSMPTLLLFFSPSSIRSVHASLTTCFSSSASHSPGLSMQHSLKHDMLLLLSGVLNSMTCFKSDHPTPCTAIAGRMQVKCCRSLSSTIC